LLAEAGIRFHTGVAVGRDVSFGELRTRHDAIVVATGVYKPRDLAMPGVGLGNIFPAMDYLTASNRKGLGDAVPRFEDGTLDADGRRVVVIGGGDTAMDCVRTAVRQGARSVACLYRRNQANMPGSMREVQYAMEEGVEFIWLAEPEAFLGDGVVRGVRAVRMRLGPPDPSGRQSPQVIEGSQFTLPADMVITALGFDPEELPSLFGVPQLKVSRWGTISVSFKSFMTNLDGVFAIGDIVRGASLVVWAIRDGRDAAESVDNYLREKAATTAPAVAAE
jgi:glutamate synthase (NADPH/NADH) small chain